MGTAHAPQAHGPGIDPIDSGRFHRAYSPGDKTTSLSLLARFSLSLRWLCGPTELRSSSNDVGSKVVRLLNRSSHCRGNTQSVATHFRKSSVKWRLKVNSRRDFREVIQNRSAPRLRPNRPMNNSITEWMRMTRRKTLRERVNEYSLGRIQEQQFWYSTRAYLNARAHRRWNLLLVVLELVGFGIGLAQAVNEFPVRSLSALAVMAAIIAAITVWTHARQFASLASAYSQAEQELLLIGDLVGRPRSETEWAEFVQSAETAISREHRMWQSSRVSV